MHKLITTLVAVLLCTASVGGSINLQTATHAIIEMSEGCLIGGARNQKWIDADHFPKPLKKSLPVSIYTLKGLEGEFTLSVSPKSECHDYWTSKESEQISSGIAIERPSWNVMPRMPRPIDLQDTTYVAIVRDVLRSAGIKKPEVKITQGYKIDLDGDGKDEVVLAANRYVKGAQELTGFSAGTEPGDYTLVLVRKIVGESVRNIILVKAVWLKENEGPLPRGNHISAIADLNGDGTNNFGADPGQDLVTVELYRDINGNGKLDLTIDQRIDSFTSTTINGVPGSFQVSGGPGTLFLREIVPSGFSQTQPGGLIG